MPKPPQKARLRQDKDDKEFTPESIANNTANVEDVQDADTDADGQVVNFDELRNLAGSILKQNPDSPRHAGHLGDVGDPIVRMMNQRGDCVAVSYRMVPNRITDGYSFIEGEPTIPSLSTPPGFPQDLPEQARGSKTYRAHPRHMQRDIKQIPDAQRHWLKHMQDDMRDPKMRSRSDLQWNYVRELAQAVAAIPQKG